MHGQKNENRKCQNVTNVIVMADFSKKYQGYCYCILLVVFLAIHSMIANSIFFREHIFFRPYQRLADRYWKCKEVSFFFSSKHLFNVHCSTGQTAKKLLIYADSRIYLHICKLLKMAILIFSFQTLLQVCERIPTIATQLKILSTVKATMLGAQGNKLHHFLKMFFIFFF